MAKFGDTLIETYSSRSEWLAARKRGIGASDSPCILGMGRFRSAYSVATDKLTEAIDDDFDEAADWGLRLEGPIAQKFVEVTGIAISDPRPFTIYRSIERPHLFCTPDRMTEDGVLEIKTAHFEAGKEWAERIPLAYQVQLQQSLYCTGRQRGWFAVLVDGYRWKYHPMARNDKWIAKMLPRLDAFWAAVQRGEYPNVDAAEATARALARRYPTPTAGHVELPNELTELGDEYDQILADASRLDERKTLIQNIIREAIGNGTVGVLSDASGFSWAANGKGTRTLRRVKKVKDLNG